MSESNRRRLFELLRHPDNAICAECDHEGPDWGSYNIGVFLCNSCASIHRSLGSHISRIKSVKLDNWDKSQVTSMENTGNRVARELYEKYLPQYYRRPKHGDPQVAKEQWIRAKYERKEFVEPSDTAYNRGCLEGFLWKRGKEDGKFAQRKFVLSQVEGNLQYFVKISAKSPKAIITISHINVTFCPQKVNNPNGLQLTYLKDGKTRSIFVYSEDGKTTMDWYTAIRAAKLHHLQIAFPNIPVQELTPFLTRDFLQEGFLWKTGPRIGDSYKKRFFVLDDRKLMYLVHPLDAYPKGEIFLGEKDEGYTVKDGIPADLKYHPFGFTLFTPERTYLFGAENEEEKEDWIKAIEMVVDRPPAPQDYSVNLRSELRNSYQFKKRRGSQGSGGSGRNSGGSFGSTLRKGKNFFSFSSNSS